MLEFQMASYVILMRYKMRKRSLIFIKQIFIYCQAYFAHVGHDRGRNSRFRLYDGVLSLARHYQSVYKCFTNIKTKNCSADCTK